MVKNNQKGFSLLGVMIAMFITTLGLVGILAFSNAALNSISTSKTKLIAAGLAQEGIEIVRAIRAGNSDWSDWYQNIVDGDYYVQYNSQCLGCCPDMDNPCPSPAGDGAPLELGPYEYYEYYEYESGEGPIYNPASFYRKITLTKILDNETKVVVEVKYSNYKLIVEDRLWNWK